MPPTTEWSGRDSCKLEWKTCNPVCRKPNGAQRGKLPGKSAGAAPVRGKAAARPRKTRSSKQRFNFQRLHLRFRRGGCAGLGGELPKPSRRSQPSKEILADMLGPVEDPTVGSLLHGLATIRAVYVLIHRLPVRNAFHAGSFQLMTDRGLTDASVAAFTPQCITIPTDKRRPSSALLRLRTRGAPQHDGLTNRLINAGIRQRTPYRTWSAAGIYPAREAFGARRSE